LVHNDLLGPRLHLSGGVLKQFADKRHWGDILGTGAWNERLNAQLSVAFSLYKFEWNFACAGTIWCTKPLHGCQNKLASFKAKAENDSDNFRVAIPGGGSSSA